MSEIAVPDWASIREEYEGRQFLPTVICRRHGISVAQLRYRREMEGWLSARARVPKQADLVARMLKSARQADQKTGGGGERADRQTGQCLGHASEDARQAYRAWCRQAQCRAGEPQGYDGPAGQARQAHGAVQGAVTETSGAARNGKCRGTPSRRTR